MDLCDRGWECYGNSRECPIGFPLGSLPRVQKGGDNIFTEKNGRDLFLKNQAVALASETKNVGFGVCM